MNQPIQLQALREQTTDSGSALLQQLLTQQRNSFDPDAWHVMQQRDSSMIRDELMHGVSSKAYVYSFNLQGKQVTGVSVIGARELASQYKGIKSRIVATIEKRGALFIFRTFTPLSIETRSLHDLAEDDDYYECVMELSDIKTGNSIEVRKKEMRTELKRDGTAYVRQHFDTIAESKAYRNGVLSILPQSVIQEFKERALKAGNASNERTIDQLRAAAGAHAAKNAVALDRIALSALTYDELTGLGAAAGQGLEQFKASAQALGLVRGSVPDPSTGEIDPPATPAQPKNAPTADQRGEDWTPSPADLAAINAREMAESAGGTPARRTRSASLPIE